MAMALSASVWNPLKLSSAGGNSREAFCRQPSLPQVRASLCMHHVGASGRSWDTLNGKRSARVVVGGKRVQWRQKLGQGQGMVVRASENNSSNERGDTGTASSSSEADVEALEARLGVGRRARKQQQAEGGGGPQSNQGAPAKPKQPGKTWDSMGLVEKAWSLYIDPEQGILFWLNKLAYGAIFAIIGGWIVFRFIGPALGFYQLDQPLLSPDRLLDGP